MKEELSNYLNRYVLFSNDEIDTFYSLLKPKTFKKKDYILKAGNVCNFKFFIINGLVRVFRIDEKGNEKIIHFGIEHWWMTNMESFIKQTPSQLYIQALEDTTLLSITKADLETAYQKLPKLERVFRIISENMLIAMERKNDYYFKLSSKERYEDFVTQLKSFSQRVPQYMIASYLDITPEYLSELRKSK